MATFVVAMRVGVGVGVGLGVGAGAAIGVLKVETVVFDSVLVDVVSLLRS